MFAENLTDYMASGHPFINIRTVEKDRCIEHIILASQKIDRRVLTWSVATGWKNPTISDESLPAAEEPEDAIKSIVSFDNKTVFVLKDFDIYFSQTTYSKADIVVSWIQEVLPILSGTERTIILVGVSSGIPEVLKHHCVFIEFDFPDDEHINKLIDYVVDGVSGDIEIDKTSRNNMISACRGMSQSQIIDRIALAIRKTKTINDSAVELVLHEKANIIKSSNLLTYHDIPDFDLSSVGGYDAVKHHIMMDKPCFSDDARDFGIDPPKGIMLVGIPGCGKTLLSKAIAGELKFPMVSMDVGNMMDSLVGSSESNMREAIKLLDSIAPVVVQLDEIEKGFGGAGDMDGGSSRRVFGSFLKWLSEKNNLVYVVATANNISSLPVEFLRKGRFDEIFGMDLPSEEERSDIFSIHIRKRGKSVDGINLEKLARQTVDFTGSDIEQVVKHALKLAFRQKSCLCNPILETSIKTIVPLARLESERIRSLREWMSSHTKIANPTKNIVSQPKRSIKL